jgi:hypothetical protein
MSTQKYLELHLIRDVANVVLAFMEPSLPTQEGYAQTGFWEKLDVVRMCINAKETCLYVACQQDYPHIVDLLLNHGAMGICRGLFATAVHNNISSFKTIISHSNDEQLYNFKTHWYAGYSFKLGCINNNIEMVDTLLKIGVYDVESASLLEACIRGQTELVNLLINADRYNNSAIDCIIPFVMIAEKYGHTEIAKAIRSKLRKHGR